MTDGGRTSTLKALLENPYLINPPKILTQDGKKEDDSDWTENFDVTAAFLGPALWSKTLPLIDNEFKLEYMNLDEFFTDKEANDRKSGYERRSLGSIGTSDDDGSSSTSSNDSSCKDHGISNKNESGHNMKSVQEFKQEKCVHLMANQSELCFSPADLALASFPGKEFDPSNKRFTDNELKPQPMYKKCKKQLVPNDMKDDRYWARRVKNNVAAKRSRDARRIKENQIVMRAAYLENENHVLKKEMEALRQENQSLLAKLQRMDDC